MQQEIDQPRGRFAAEQVAQELFLFRPDAGKARDRRKQGIEEERAHQKNLKLFLIVLPGFMPSIHVFFLERKVLTFGPPVAISTRPGTSGLLALGWI